MKKLDFQEFDKAYNEDLEARAIWKQQQLARQKQRKKIQGYFLYGVMTLLAFAVLAITINGYVEMNRVKYGNAQLQEQIAMLEADIDALEIQIEQKANSASLREIAETELGLIPASEAQHRQVHITQTFTLKRNTESAIVMEGND